MSEAPFLGKFECTSCKCCTVEITEHLFLPGFFCAYYKCGTIGGCCPVVVDCATPQEAKDGKLPRDLVMEGGHCMTVKDRDTLVDCFCFNETRVVTSAGGGPAAQQMER